MGALKNTFDASVGADVGAAADAADAAVTSYFYLLDINLKNWNQSVNLHFLCDSSTILM